LSSVLEASAVTAACCAAILAFLTQVRLPEMTTVPLAPPNPDEAKWNDGRAKQREWNCYNYATNEQTWGKDANGNKVPVKAQPGRKGTPGKSHKDFGGSVAKFLDWYCENVQSRAENDGLKKIAWKGGDNPPPDPDKGQNLVALAVGAVVLADGSLRRDYHWWRRNADGSWSHKPGSNKATTKYREPTTGKMKAVSNPGLAAQRGFYTSFCSFMAYTKDPPPNIGPIAAALPDSCLPSSGAVVLTSAGMSGEVAEEVLLMPADVNVLVKVLPTLSADNEVDDPEWDPLGFDGFMLFADEDHWRMLPSYVRVFDGVVEVAHYREDLKEWGFFYYADDHGLEPFVTERYDARPRGACCAADGSGCFETTSCACAAYGGLFTEDVSCADIQCPAPCLGDLNGDGVVDVLDLLALLDAWGPNPGHPADLNGDGVVDVLDLLILLDNWGPCPVCPLECEDNIGEACPGIWGDPDHINGGCNATPPVYSTAVCGETYCGQLWADNGFRDLDWFRLDLSAAEGVTKITWSAQAELPEPIRVNLWIGTHTCPPTILAFNIAECVNAVSACVPPGVYTLIIAPNVFDGASCYIGPHQYLATVTCATPCDAPPPPSRTGF
jgi:hypothetical protein